MASRSDEAAFAEGKSWLDVVDHGEAAASRSDEAAFAKGKSWLDEVAAGSIAKAAPMGGLLHFNIEKIMALSFDPQAYMNYLNQPSVLAKSNDPAYYLDKTRFPNGPMAIDYTKPSFWQVKEKVSNFFVDSKWEGEGWSANGGVRFVHVNSSSIGISRTLLSATKSPNDTTYILNWGPSSCGKPSMSAMTRIGMCCA